MCCIIYIDCGTIFKHVRLPEICQQSGAAEACWAHNPEVDGSKPSSAKKYCDRIVVSISHCDRGNPGSNPGHSIMYFKVSWIMS